MKYSQIIRVAILATILPLTACGEQTTTRLTVVDENGEPIEGARAGVVYYSQTPATVAGDHGEGLTDQNGLYVFSGRAFWLGQIGATKDGFYGSSRELEVTEPDHRGHARVKNDIDTALTLREIRYPVPMYAGRIRIPFPNPSGGTYAFDLLKRDWVSPYGDGKQADILITLDFDYQNRNDFNIELKWEFNGEGNGIQAFEPVVEYSRFKSPHYAPESGYLPKINWSWYRRPNPNIIRQVGERDTLLRTDFEFSTAAGNPKNFYLIRVRSTVNEEGEVVGGYFGKIYSSGSLALAIEGNENAELFTGVIYINSVEGDRNIEFDPENNLIEGLSRELKPRFP